MPSPQRSLPINMVFPQQTSCISSFSPPASTALLHRDSFVHQRELESAFCRDLVCCNQQISDLHDLLHHYEEHHGREGGCYDSNRTHSPHEGRSYNETHSTTPVSMSHIAFEQELSSPRSVSNEANNDHPILLSNHDLTALENFGGQHHNQENGLLPPSPSLSQSSATSVDMVVDALQPQSNQSNKPYKCEVPGCEKTYKNPNGLKYHRLHGHCEQSSDGEGGAELQKPHKCTIGMCRKRYKNLNGLKYHIEHAHASKPIQQLAPHWISSQQQPISPWQHF